MDDNDNDNNKAFMNLGIYNLFYFHFFFNSLNSSPFSLSLSLSRSPSVIGTIVSLAGPAVSKYFQYYVRFFWNPKTKQIKKIIANVA